MRSSQPKLLFFTGGTALRDLSRCLARKSSNSIHLVTTFDSGGSTAELRRCLAIPALGDLRNRMLALADPALNSPLLLESLDWRCPKKGANAELLALLLNYADPHHPMWSEVDSSKASFLCTCLHLLLQKLPSNFVFQGASLGNLILAGLYLHNNREFSPTLEYMKKFLQVRGTVLPIVDECLNLGCELVDGSFIIGQHKFKNLNLAIKNIFLTVHEPREVETISQDDFCHPKLSKSCLHWFELADLICYPMGSFYSSILVNLLVKGVGRRVQKLSCPKIYIPNLGFDPELKDLSIEDQVDTILKVLHGDASHAKDSELLSYVLIDSRYGDYQGRLTKDTEAKLAQRGFELLDQPLNTTPKRVVHDPQALLESLWTLALKYVERSQD
ncbi:MAG: GAK system CofD-like protein [Desulfovibrionaceae bacterium]|nr:GAK system CofD-like protein [Desulfovibrionaceae bacterium]